MVLTYKNSELINKSVTGNYVLFYYKVNKKYFFFIKKYYYIINEFINY